MIAITATAASRMIVVKRSTSSLSTPLAVIPKEKLVEVGHTEQLPTLPRGDALNLTAVHHLIEAGKTSSRGVVDIVRESTRGDVVGCCSTGKHGNAFGLWCLHAAYKRF